MGETVVYFRNDSSGFAERDRREREAATRGNILTGSQNNNNIKKKGLGNRRSRFPTIVHVTYAHEPVVAVCKRKRTRRIRAHNSYDENEIDRLALYRRAGLPVYSRKYIYTHVLRQRPGDFRAHKSVKRSKNLREERLALRSSPVEFVKEHKMYALGLAENVNSFRS